MMLGEWPRRTATSSGTKKMRSSVSAFGTFMLLSGGGHRAAGRAPRTTTRFDYSRVGGVSQREGRGSGRAAGAGALHGAGLIVEIGERRSEAEEEGGEEGGALR